ncbi:MAG: winged helix-turn-helix transcriptional regulator [Chloroflexi bacterium]|nr:winged helix-turn-helix transcriptional regulator [Chloroflexota bacterium]
MASTPQFIWDISTAYDFFISLDVLHEPARYGLRGNWAAGVRSRLPAEYREFLQGVTKNHQLWAVPWILSLPGHKDSAAVLDRLEEIPAAQRLREISSCFMYGTHKELLFDVADRGTWNETDKEALREIYLEKYRKEGKKKKKVDEDVVNTLDIWANSEQFGDSLLNSLKCYYQVFFKEEESRILSAMTQMVTNAKQLAEKMPLDELLNELSQGLRFDLEGTGELEELVMIPSFWITPLTYFGPIGEDQKQWVFLFGGRPVDVSLVPGEIVPELLYNTLKALADPTRLRILKYLSEEPLTPAELARRLRLRPPTVIHHLDVLRLARLVHVTLSHQGRRYEARREAIEATCTALEKFFNRDLPE